MKVCTVRLECLVLLLWSAGYSGPPGASASIGTRGGAGEIERRQVLVFAHLVHVTLGRVHECVFGVLAAGRPNFVRALLRSSITSSSRLARRRSTCATQNWEGAARR
jgi:hypothetical protein